MSKHTGLIVLSVLFIVLFVIAGSVAGFFGYLWFKQKYILQDYESSLRNLEKDCERDIDVCKKSLRECQSSGGNCLNQLNQVKKEYQSLVTSCEDFVNQVQEEQTKTSGAEKLLKILNWFI